MVDQRSTAVCVYVVLLSLLFDLSLEQQPQLLRSRVERLALLQLRSSLGLRTREWPIKSDPCLSWAGVQCQNGRVIGINVSGFRRTRLGSQNPQFAVDALQNFTLLASFNASSFTLQGSIPEWFGLRLASLQVLDLRSSSISGAIPTTLGNLSRLTSLYLSDNNLTGSVPSSLGQLSLLDVLDLSRNKLSGSIPVSFGSLANLSLLSMSSNSLTGGIPPGIGTLPRLRVLNFSGNTLSSSIPAQLGNISSLVDLDLGDNFLSGPVPPDLRGLRNLQRIVVGNNSLSGSLPDDLFPPLTQLQFVVLSSNAITGALPNALLLMPQLQFLDVSRNNFTGTLPNLSSDANATGALFNLSRNLFYGNIGSVVRRFSIVDLSGNYFQGTVPDYAQSNVSLSENCLRNLSSQKSRDDCQSFYLQRGIQFDDFGPNATQPPPTEPNNRSSRTLIIMVAVLGGVGLLVVTTVVLVLLILCTRKRRAINQRGIGVGPVPAGASPPQSGTSINFSSLGDAFTYQQILQATGEFNDENLAKHGHSGVLYRGIIEGGVPVIIKKIDSTSVKKEASMSELDFFSKVSHPRLVPLLGHCLENENEKFLVYKYMPNGDLSSSLFKKNIADDDSLQSLDWIIRMKIAIGAAEGLSYLHHECSPPFVHRGTYSSYYFAELS